MKRSKEQTLMIAEIKQILKYFEDSTSLNEEEFVKLFVARKRSQRQERLPAVTQPRPEATPANKDLAEVLERSESGLSRATDLSFSSESPKRFYNSPVKRNSILVKEIDGSASLLQNKIEAMRIRDDYEEQNKIA